MGLALPYINAWIAPTIVCGWVVRKRYPPSARAMTMPRTAAATLRALCGLRMVDVGSMGDAESGESAGFNGASLDDGDASGCASFLGTLFVALLRRNSMAAVYSGR